MKRIIQFLLAAAIAGGVSLLAQSAPDLNYEANADVLTLPSYGEVAGIATNSRGHVFVYARTGHGVATLGDERTFYHGGSRLFEFDQNGKLVKEIGQGVYAVNFAQQVRVDPQDNIWIVDSGSNQVVKFDAIHAVGEQIGFDPRVAAVLRPAPDDVQWGAAGVSQLEHRVQGGPQAAPLARQQRSQVIAQGWSFLHRRRGTVL